LVSFSGSGTDGANPIAALTGYVANGKGKLFGATYAGGTGHTGTVFELLLLAGGAFGEGPLQSILGGDGANPLARLAEDQLGDNLYGTAVNGGLYTKGTVFKLAEKSNKLTPVHQFGGVLKGRCDGQILSRASFPTARAIFSAPQT
jgi:uncharacterized repeat protein (TIGR03803 family)